MKIINNLKGGAGKTRTSMLSVEDYTVIPIDLDCNNSATFSFPLKNKNHIQEALK